MSFQLVPVASGLLRRTPRTLGPDRSEDLRWFPLDALPEPVVPHEHQVMTAVRDGRVLPIGGLGFPD